MIPSGIRLLIASRAPSTIPPQISGFPEGISPGITPRIYQGYLSEISSSMVLARISFKDFSSDSYRYTYRLFSFFFLGFSRGISRDTS